jgi:hypothetical protein
MKITIIQKEEEEEEEKRNRFTRCRPTANGERNLVWLTWNVRTLYRTGELRMTINELRKYKIATTAIQETRWTK